MITTVPAASVAAVAVGWRAATQEALYGPAGFFRREAPAAHFRTSVHVSLAYAGAVAHLAEQVGARTVLDVGSGRGELLVALAAVAPGLDLVGVDLAKRPEDLPPQIGWRQGEVPGVLTGASGAVGWGGLTDTLVVANEWLDDVPVDVAEVGDDGTVRLVEVDPATGAETLGAPVAGRDADWLRRWWPLDGASPGDRAEVGWPRDDAWAGLVAAVRRGVLLAVDYGHERGRRPAYGTLTGYRAGRQVSPVPDGSCDLTSHVALDAVAAAGEAAGASASLLTDQRTALRALGVDGRLPPHAQAQRDPAAYARGLQAASAARELLDPGSLGGFGWLLQGAAQPLPRGLR